MAKREPTQIPAWARYTAVDDTGEVWAYSHRPAKDMHGWDIGNAPHMRAEKIGISNRFEDWRDSLICLR